MKNMLIGMMLDAAAEGAPSTGTTDATSTTPQWVTDLTQAIINVLNPILILACVAGIIYAIVVGVKFAKADDKSQRDEAKQKLITVIVGIVVTLVLIALFFWIKSQLPTWLKSLETAI